MKRVKYLGASSSQIRWGNGSDPKGTLVEGKIYTLMREEIHDWHTKYYLLEFPELGFNSVFFENA